MAPLVVGRGARLHARARRRRRADPARQRGCGRDPQLRAVRPGSRPPPRARPTPDRACTATDPAAGDPERQARASAGPAPGAGGHAGVAPTIGRGGRLGDRTTARCPWHRHRRPGRHGRAGAPGGHGAPGSRPCTLLRTAAGAEPGRRTRRRALADRGLLGDGARDPARPRATCPRTVAGRATPARAPEGDDTRPRPPQGSARPPGTPSRSTRRSLTPTARTAAQPAGNLRRCAHREGANRTRVRAFVTDRSAAGDPGTGLRRETRSRV